MERLWDAIGRRREDVIARSSAFVQRSAFLQRTRETSADILARAERRATELQVSLSSRRSGLDGKTFAHLERRLLLRLEDVLQRVGQGLRVRVQRLSPGAGRAAIEPDAPVAPEEAVLVDEAEIPSGAMPRVLEAAAPPVDSSAPLVPASPARAPAARAKSGKKRIRVAAVAAAPAPAAAEDPRPKRTRTRAAAKSERPAARRVTTKAPAKAPKVASARPSAKSANGKASTRWVARPAEVEVEELGKLPAKTLLARIPALDDASCRALLAHEKQTKKRKSVVDALAARLPS